MINAAEELAIVLNQIRKGSIYIKLKDGSKVVGKFIDTTDVDIIVDARILYKAFDKTKICDLGRIEVPKKHVERWLVCHEGGKH